MTLVEIRQSLALSKAEVSRQAGVSVYTLDKLEHNKFNVPAHKLASIMITYSKQYGIDMASIEI